MGFFENIFNFTDRYLYWFNFSGMRPADFVEIIIIAILIYEVLAWVKRTRAMSLFKGIVVLLVGILVAAIFQMNTIMWIAGKLFNAGLIALVVVFQPELRSALEHLGQRQFFKGLFGFETQDKVRLRATAHMVDEVTKACFEMGRVKTGALIVFEKDTPLTEFIRTGIDVDALVTRQILINIFEKNTPLHDGAVIIQNTRIAAATCYLPLSDNMEISKALGTRHRAAIGISEVSDSLTIVVSEETGGVSAALDGVLIRDLTPDSLDNMLRDFFRQEQEDKELLGNRFMKRRVKEHE